MKFYKDFDLKEFVANTDLFENLPDGKYYYQYQFYEHEKYCVSVKSGKKHGVEEKYTDNKIRQINNYDNGKRQGLEISYNKEGAKIVEKYYNNDLLFYEIHFLAFQKKKEKTLEQIKQLERVLKELKESVGETGCKDLGF